MMESAVEIGRFEKIADIQVSASYRSYPVVYNQHLIPAEPYQLLHRLWQHDHVVNPPVGIYLLKNVYVASQGLVFTESGALVAETQTQHTEEDINMAREALFTSLAARQALPSHERGILCKKPGSGNYGHWLVEMLPKAFLAKRNAGLGDWPVIVHEASEGLTRVVRESLAVFGFAAEQIKTTGKAPEHFAELVVVDGLSSHAVFISPLVMECMEFIIEKAGTATSRALYVPRRPAVSRDFADEPAMAEFFSKSGYREVVAGHLPFLDQVAAFRGAERVAGVMGAAMANIIFCRPGTEVIAFAPASALELFFWHICEARRLRYYEYRCEETGEVVGSLPWNRDLLLTADQAQAMMEGLRPIQDHVRPVPPLPPIERDKPAVTRQQIMDGIWRWKFSHQSAYIYNIRFLPDGSISGYRHGNEHRWGVRDGTLEIYTVDGACSWHFEDVSGADDALSLQADYMLNRTLGITLTVTQVPAYETTHDGAPVKTRFEVVNLAEIMRRQLTDGLGEPAVTQRPGLPDIEVPISPISYGQITRPEQAIDHPAHTWSTPSYGIHNAAMYVLRGAVVHGEQGIITVQDMIVEESLYINNWEMLGFERDATNQKVFYLTSYQPPQRRIAAAAHALCCFIGNRNYAHWWVDVVAAILVPPFHDAFADTTVLLPQIRNDWQTQTMALLPELENRAVLVAENERIACDELRFVPQIMKSDLTPHPFRRKIYSILKQRAGHDGTAFRKLYLNRHDAGARKLANEAEVEALLARYGFESVTMTGRPVAEQIRLFAQTTHIISPHGAGLGNIIFCPPDAALCELQMMSSVQWSLRRLASSMGLRYGCVVGVAENDDVDVGQRVWRVKLAELEAVLNDPNFTRPPQAV